MFEKIIEFTSPHPDWLISPKPAKKCIPEWFKKMKNHFGEFKDYNNPTIKKCVPVLDSITSGYIILNPAEVVFTQQKDEVTWRYKDQLHEYLEEMNLGIELHNTQQISKEMCDSSEYEIAFKYINPWRIKTPKNYSCIFTNPFNNKVDNIRIITGIVDTDEYKSNINFPFFLKKMKLGESFVLKKNAPIALVFPFLRDSWKMQIKKEKKNEELTKKENFKLFSLIEDNYKKCIWKKKKYD